MTVTAGKARIGTHVDPASRTEPWDGSEPANERGRPVAIRADPDEVFGFLHWPSTEAQLDTAVLICPPWGWDEITSYRPRRAWAQRLAAAGFTALRIDLPAAGD